MVDVAVNTDEFTPWQEQKGRQVVKEVWGLLMTFRHYIPVS